MNTTWQMRGTAAMPSRRRVGAVLIAVALLAAACVALALLVTPASAFQSPSAREGAMAGSYLAVARGVDAVWGNPANLALPGGERVSVSILSVNTGLSNNSISLRQYNELFDGGALSAGDKNDILESIPESGFTLRADAGLNALGFSVGRIAAAVTPRLSASGGIPRDYFDLILNGNEVGRSYSIAEAYGEGFAVVEGGVAYAQPVSVSFAEDFCVGVGVKMLVGLGYGEVTESSGTLRTDITGAETRGNVVIRYAGETVVDGNGDESFTMVTGRGLALDLGVAGRVAGWTCSAVLRDLSPGINWSKGTERAFEFGADSLTVEAAGDDFFASSDTVYAVDGFTSPYPPSLRVGGSRAFGSFLVACDYEQGFRNFAGTSTTPRVSGGAEYTALRVLPLRMGLSLGGESGRALAGGFGLRLGPWATDFAVRNRGITSGGSKGLSFALGTSLHF